MQENAGAPAFSSGNNNQNNVRYAVVAAGRPAPRADAQTAVPAGEIPQHRIRDNAGALAEINIPVGKVVFCT